MYTSIALETLFIEQKIQRIDTILQKYGSNQRSNSVTKSTSDDKSGTGSSREGHNVVEHRRIVEYSPSKRTRSPYKKSIRKGYDIGMLFTSLNMINVQLRVSQISQRTLLLVT